MNMIRTVCIIAAAICLSSQASAQLLRRGAGRLRNAFVRPAQTQPAPVEVAPAAHPGHYALIIAAREYPNAKRLRSLPGANRDALRTAASLRAGGFPADNVVVIYDDAEDPSLRPTRANIEAQLAAMLTRAADPESLLAVFATGHGVSLKGVSYLCPGDATDRALSDPAIAARELVSVAEVATLMSKQCESLQKLLVVDACRDTGNERTGGFVQSVGELEKPAEGVWLMSSCSEGEYSWMSDKLEPGERHAVFSYYIAEGLRGAADLLGDNDGKVGLFELYTYGFQKTRRAAAAIRENQTPELFGLAGPFTLTTTRSFVSRRKLTTSDPALEDGRSALLLADDVLINLRGADAYFRETVSADGVTRQQIRESNAALHQYLCHLLGNRIHAALEFDAECKLAHLARGLCYRTCGMYEESLRGFTKGGEHLELFVKADVKSMDRFIARDESGGVLRDEIGRPIPSVDQGARSAEQIGSVSLHRTPGGAKSDMSVSRQAKVRISHVRGRWLQVSAINDQPLDEPLWISEQRVHWFPEAVDLYSPSTPMRPWGTGGAAATRFDYAAQNLHAMADRLAAPARRIELAALPFVRASNRLYEVSARLRRVTERPNRLISFANQFGAGIPSIPNPAADYAALAAHYVRVPANKIYMVSSYARIPAGYVRMVGGYAQTGGNYARTAQQLAGAVHGYQQGHQTSETVEDARNELDKEGKLEPVEEKPVRVVLEVARLSAK